MPKKGYKQTKEHKRKIGEFKLKNPIRYWLGKKFSEDTRIKMSKAKKGQPSPMKGIRMSDETKRKLSESHKGQIPWNKDKKGVQAGYWKGKNRPNLSGNKSHFWKGGIMKNKTYIIWSKNKRNRVVKRLKEEGSSHTFGDWETLKAQYGYMCPCCKKSEPDIKLTEDHIIPLSKGGSDNIENIQPLCFPCNAKKHTLIIKY